MTIYVKDLVKYGKTFSGDLLTRPVGRKYYDAAAKKTKAAMQGEVVVVDFEKIRVIDPSFADEFVIKLINLSSENDFYIRLKNLGRSAANNISSIIDSYSRFAQTELAVPVEEITESGSHFIGNLDGIKADIAEFFRINKTAGLETIINKFSITESQTEEILESLNSLRIIRKDDSGKYFSVL